MLGLRFRFLKSMNAILWRGLLFQLWRKKHLTCKSQQMITPRNHCVNNEFKPTPFEIAVIRWTTKSYVRKLIMKMLHWVMALCHWRNEGWMCFFLDDLEIPTDNRKYFPLFISMNSYTQVGLVMMLVDPALTYCTLVIQVRVQQGLNSDSQTFQSMFCIACIVNNNGLLSLWLLGHGNASPLL